jgi:hypothetical protein
MAQAVWNNIPMESVNKAVDQFPILVKGIVAVDGHALNGQKNSEGSAE